MVTDVTSAEDEEEEGEGETAVGYILLLMSLELKSAGSQGQDLHIFNYWNIIF